MSFRNMVERARATLRSASKHATSDETRIAGGEPVLCVDDALNQCLLALQAGEEARATSLLSASVHRTGGIHPICQRALALYQHGEPERALALAETLGKALAPHDWKNRRKLAIFMTNQLKAEHAAAKITLIDDAFRAIQPIRLRIETASACNLRCQHCPTGVHYDATERTIMRSDLFERVLDQMQFMPSLRECVLYLGGEPLMNRNLVEMARRVKDETTVTRTFITTNGMLLSEKNCAALATAMLDQIFVSVDGRSPQENDAIRVRARYGKIVENVARLRRHLQGTGTQIVISHAMIRGPGDPDKIVTPEFLTRDFPGIHVWSDYATRWPGFDLARTELTSAELAVYDRPNFCGFPFAEMSVRVTGDVVLCCHDLLGESVMGNIWKTDLLDIWNGAAYRDLRKHMLARDAQGVHEVCRRCFVFTGERIERSALTELPIA